MAIYPPPQVRAAILRWRASHPGLTCRQIGAHFGVSGLTVHRVLLTQAADGISSLGAALGDSLSRAIQPGGVRPQSGSSHGSPAAT